MAHQYWWESTADGTLSTNKEGTGVSLLPVWGRKTLVGTLISRGRWGLEMYGALSRMQRLLRHSNFGMEIPNPARKLIINVVGENFRCARLAARLVTSL
jgi:hypothetical protein